MKEVEEADAGDGNRYIGRLKAAGGCVAGIEFGAGILDTESKRLEEPTQDGEAISEIMVWPAPSLRIR